jgi:hypothetical protein
MRVAGRALSPVRRISSVPGMGDGQFFDCPRLGGSGTTRGGGERLLGGCGAAGGRNWREVAYGRRIEHASWGGSRGNHGGSDSVLLAQEERGGVLRLEQHGEAVTAVVQSSASRGMARTGSDVRRRGRPMVRGGAAGQRVRAWRVVPTRAHPRRAQKPERNARTDGHRPVSVCARTVAEPTGHGRGDVACGAHVPARDISV